MICGKSYSFRIRFPKEYAFTKTFESVFDEDTFFNSCILVKAGEALGLLQEKSWKTVHFFGMRSTRKSAPSSPFMREHVFLKQFVLSSGKVYLKYFQKTVIFTESVYFL